jgi:hypothetical protein
MQSSSLTRSAMLALLVAGLACARNSSSNDDVGAARDSTRIRAATTDSVANQTESGVTDSSGTSTLGKDVGKTRPDQGQPVTAKGDTVNSGVDSSASAR